MSDLDEKQVSEPEENQLEIINEPMALDDKQRIKVMSPGLLVFKRFVRSKLATAGTIILIFMFAFAFLGTIISPYNYKEVFHKYDYLATDYAMAVERTEFSNIELNGIEVHYSVAAMINSAIASFTEGQTEKEMIDSSGAAEYNLVKLGDSCYVLDQYIYAEIGSYSTMSATFTFSNISYDILAFRTIVLNSIATSENQFEYLGEDFKLVKSGKSYLIQVKQAPIEAIITSTLVFDSYSETAAGTGFKVATLKSLYDTQAFSYEGTDYVIEGDEDLYTVYAIIDGENEPYMNLSHFVVRRYNGEDTLSIDYKAYVESVIADLESNNIQESEFTYSIETVNEETGEPEITEEDFSIRLTTNNYVIQNVQLKYLIDINGSPSLSHWLGTDSNGMDVLTRMMYGGRISLMIGFIVVIIEVIIGVILGGIAGFFGKWVDNLIMRLVDIFNCIPFLPIMIIVGSVFDQMQMDSYERILWLMVMMGILGWPGVARLVRGQILSLREQEFMIAAEATGLSTKRRIFRHLIPNVMPQLIVSATMGLGGIILTESTLSFLGLGAKYPIATWGAMIYSVSNASDLVDYTYIWIPVGVLICLTVIAFNFVGDGLRDAFDPRMKR